MGAGYVTQLYQIVRAGSALFLGMFARREESSGSRRGTETEEQA
jgi:hypothetical protein